MSHYSDLNDAITESSEDIRGAVGDYQRHLRELTSCPPDCRLGPWLATLVARVSHDGGGLTIGGLDRLQDNAKRIKDLEAANKKLTGKQTRDPAGVPYWDTCRRRAACPDDLLLADHVQNMRDKITEQAKRIKDLEAANQKLHDTANVLRADRHCLTTDVTRLEAVRDNLLRDNREQVDYHTKCREASGCLSGMLLDVHLRDKAYEHAMRKVTLDECREAAGCGNDHRDVVAVIKRLWSASEAKGGE